MKKILLTFVCFIGIVLLASCAKDEENLSGTIAGLVTNYTNANTPIAGATVTLSAKGLSKTTGSDGRFEFTDIEPGTYTLQVIANNFQPTTKQVTVYAGQKANCDFQLSVSSINVDISPIMLTFGGTTEQLSLTITNNSNNVLNYTISNIPSFIQVSPSTGSVAAKGKQTVTVSVINRAAITSSRNGQMTINIGSDSYNVSINVESYQHETVSVDINPTSLHFDKNTEQLKFTMASNYSKAMDYTITSNLDILAVTPTNGTLAAHGQAGVSVTVNNRKNVNTDRNGSLTISMGGNTYVINVSVDKYEENVIPSTPVSTTRGLQAYYPFDDNTPDDASGNKYHGVLSGGTFITDTPNGKGKALSLKAKEYVSIGYNPLSDKKAQTVSMWIKDFNVGTLLYLANNNSVSAPTFFISENMKLSCYYYGNKYSFYEANTTLTAYQEGQWTMVTLVVSNTGLSDYINSKMGTLTFYVNGRRIDSREERIASLGTSITIGGRIMQGGNEVCWNSAFKVDNVRIHGVALSDDEIEAIYNAERK
ncbi:MAG: carboxypeptidase regulatory-like domain-containing protein [Prevotella sp.]|nr:carboxypeptidase regulatory-like domain-containing protein [Prevotella sp.]